MSSKNFMSYEDATTVLGTYAEAIKNKQGTITAGLYIQKSGDTISVKRDIAHEADEVFFAEQTNNGLHVVVTVGSTILYEENFVTSDPNHTVLDLVQTSFNVGSVRWIVKYLKASKTRSAGTEEAVWPSVTDTFVTTVDADKKLIIQSEMDAAINSAVASATSAISAIKDGVDIDSFGDVETALSAIKDGSEIDSFGDVEVALLDKVDTSDLGTAAAKDSTNAVTSGSTDLVESGAVKDAIDAAVASAYHHAGTKTVAQLTHDLLIAANEGDVYEMTDSGTTTSDFMEGMGHPIKEGDNVGVARVSEGVYKFDLLSGFVDTSNFVQKSSTAGLIMNDGTIDTVAKQPATDNNLTTTDKTTTGAINELKSGLIDVNSNLTSLGLSIVNGRLCQTYNV